MFTKAVFDLTREIFEEIFAEDPSINQPIWMKSCRIITGYFHRVKDPNDLEEIKVSMKLLISFRDLAHFICKPKKKLYRNSL